MGSESYPSSPWRSPGLLTVLLLVVSAVGAGAFLHARWQSGKDSPSAPAAASQPSPASDGVHQLPKIVARFEDEGVVVALMNDTQARDVVLDPNSDRIVVEYETADQEDPVRRVRRLPMDELMVLAPGERIDPVFVPLGEDRTRVSISFEHYHAHGVVRTTATLP